MGGHRLESDGHSGLAELRLLAMVGDRIPVAGPGFAVVHRCTQGFNRGLTVETQSFIVAIPGSLRPTLTITHSETTYGQEPTYDEVSFWPHPCEFIGLHVTQTDIMLL